MKLFWLTTLSLGFLYSLSADVNPVENVNVPPPSKEEEPSNAPLDQEHGENQHENTPEKPESEIVYVSNGIAAEVQGHVITVKEVHDRVAPTIQELRKKATNKEHYEQLLLDAQEEALEELVAQRLFITKFNSMGAKIPKAGMEAYKQDYIEDRFGPRGPLQRQNYHRYLLSTGGKSSRFQKKLEEDLEASVVGQGAYEGVSLNRLKPSELRDFYTENKLLFYQEAAVKLRMITLKPVGKESPEQLEQTAHVIAEELKKGAAFEDLAKTYSQDPMASRGGDYGWVTRLALRKDLFDIAFSLDPGAYSPIIRQGNMRYLIMLEDKHDERFQSFDDQHVQRILHQKLYEKKRKEARMAFIAKLREQDGFYVKYRL